MNEEQLDILSNTIFINEKDLNILYSELGKGVEGIVYKYTNDKVIKIFNEKEELDLSTIIDRIKYLVNVKINNFAFPENLVCNSKNQIIGYSMKLITYNEYKSFFNLSECKNNDEFINYFIKAQESLKKLHRNNIFVGDFNPNNIMIDKDNNPIFIDTINYSTPAFNFLLEPFSAKIYEKIFKSKCTLLDNDKFMFAFLFMSFFISPGDLEKAIKNPNYFKEIIDNFDISDISKITLKRIFSIKNNKEYIDDVLEDFKRNDYSKYDNKFGKIIKMIFNP